MRLPRFVCFIIAVWSFSGCSVVDALSGGSGADANVVCPPGDPSCCVPGEDPECCTPGDPTCCPLDDPTCCLPGDLSCCEPGTEGCCLPGDPTCCTPGEPNCGPPQFTCATPVELDILAMTDGIDICGQMTPARNAACGMQGGDEVAIQLPVIMPGDYEVCVIGPPGSQFTITSDCLGDTDPPVTCMRDMECTAMFLGDEDLFVLWQGDQPGQCTEIFVTITPAVPPNMDTTPMDAGQDGSMTPMP